MWLARALARLLLVVAVAFALAAVAAGLLALVRGDFLESLRVTALSLGVLLLLMGGTGGAFSRAADADARQAALGRLPGMPSWSESRPDEPTLSSGAIFAVGGLALIAVGVVVG